ncbi:MAG: hypothetical protein EHM64_03600 [Ignavibacteriae bacterium]|nr:MAG: hypothetical protein EHM64_03600 [Ignavibacteriota bacterium]
MQNMTIAPVKQDTAAVQAVSPQRLLPKFDLPEYIITGTASVDLPNMEKGTPDDSPVIQKPLLISPEKIMRDRETMELEMNGGAGRFQAASRGYSGFAKAGIGTFFTPQAEVQFGQSFQDYFYSVGGKYFLTKGYAPNTDGSGGGVTLSGGTTLTPAAALVRNAVLQGDLGYRSDSYHFYGSASPNIQRSISDFHLQTALENRSLKLFPYSAGISLQSMGFSDSSESKTETRFDLNYRTSFPDAGFPLHAAVHLMSATGGLGMMDFSAGIQNYSTGGVLFDGMLHFIWAKGMAGQHLARLCPQLAVSTQLSSQHRIFISYEQSIIPTTLATSMLTNRFLSAASSVKHQQVAGAGELGVESNWTDDVRSRVAINVKSINNLPLFSDSPRQGIWMLAYGGRATIVTFCAEMVAKLNSNDYFASNILLRSAKDSFLVGKIPYTPELEAWCSITHRFGPQITVSADLKFAGERTTDLAGRTTLPKYAVIGVKSDYTPFEFIKLSAGITNLTDSKFETWRGYREFPLTAHASVQLIW